MLQTLRSGAAGWVAKIFLGLLVLSFAVWGIEDIFRVGGGEKHAAVVGERKISIEEFRTAYQTQMRRISEEAKRVITPEQARIAGVGEQVLGNLVNEAAMDTRVTALGLTVSDEEVAREIQADEVFRGPTGSFDRATFQEVLRQNNLNEAQYLNLQRAFTARRQLTDALSANVAIPETLRQAIHSYMTDSRSIAYLALKPDAPASIPLPAGDALQKYFDAHKPSFRTQEYRKIAILAVDPESIGKTKTVPDADLRAYYDKNKPNFGSSEKRSIEQITFPTLDEAKAASEQIRNGALFEQIMAQRKLKPEDINLGDLTRDQMFDPKVGDAAFALKQGEISGPIEGQYTSAIVRVSGIQQQQVKPFEAVKEEIRAVVAEEAAKKDVETIHDKVDEARLGGATLDEIGKTQNLSVREVEAVDRAGKAPDGQPVAGLPGGPEVLEEAFGAEIGAETDAVRAGEGYVWFEVRGITPPRERNFEEARSAVEARWRDEEAKKRLDQRVKAIMAEFKAGKTIEQVAAAEKLEVDQAETTRTVGAPAITAAQANAVFDAPVEGFGASGTDEKGERIVFRVTAENTRPFDPASMEGGEQIEQIEKGMGNDVISAFVKKLRDDLGTSFDAGAIAQVVGGAS